LPKNPRASDTPSLTGLLASPLVQLVLKRQKWFMMRFKGSDAEINIKTCKREFSAWRWTPIEEPPELIVPFKRSIYRSLLDEFRGMSSLGASGHSGNLHRSQSVISTSTQ